MEDFILPLMIQALSGQCLVSESTLRGLTLFRRRGERGCESALLANKFVRAGPVPEDEDLGAYERYIGIPLPSQHLDTTRCVSLLLVVQCNPLTITVGAAAFIASAAKYLPPSDVWCILYPSLKHMLRSDVRDVDERSLLIALKPPVSRCSCVHCLAGFSQFCTALSAAI